MSTMNSVKSGKGLTDGLVSELATYWHVLPGHEEDLRAATQRFADLLHHVPSEKNLSTGLRDSRHVIFDNGQQMMWATTFESDWDPYFDDFVLIGIEHFLDWMQYTAEYTDVSAWVESSGGVEKFSPDSPDIEAQLKGTAGGLKAIVPSVQSPATGYFNQLSAWTMPQMSQGPAAAGDLPGGARQPWRRGGAAAPGTEAASRAGRRLSLPAGPPGVAPAAHASPPDCA